MKNSLTIFENLYILALDDEEGKIVESTENAMEAALACAVLAELYLQKRIDLIEGRVSLLDQASLDHPVMDLTIFSIVEAARARKLRYWINSLTYKKLLAEIPNHLVDCGVLFRKKKHLRAVVPYRTASGEEILAKFELKQHLREIVLASGQPDIDEMVLLAVLYHADLLTLVFTRGERKAAAKHIRNKIVENDSNSVLGPGLDEIVVAAYRSEE